MTTKVPETVKRYKLVRDPEYSAQMLVRPDGGYVRWTDYAALLARLQAAEAERERLGRELNIARYGQPDFSWELHKAALAEAVDRAEQAEAALTEARAETAAVIEAAARAIHRLRRSQPD